MTVRARLMSADLPIHANVFDEVLDDLQDEYSRRERESLELEWPDLEQSVVRALADFGATVSSTPEGLEIVAFEGGLEDLKAVLHATVVTEAPDLMATVWLSTGELVRRTFDSDARCPVFAVAGIDWRPAEDIFKRDAALAAPETAAQT
jgi:hypothetical protein